MKDEMLHMIKKAMQGEKDSVTLYENAAARAGDPEVEAFFASRAEWEKQHYDELLRIQQEAERHYWEINSFEPF